MFNISGLTPSNGDSSYTVLANSILAMSVEDSLTGFTHSLARNNLKHSTVLYQSVPLFGSL